MKAFLRDKQKFIAVSPVPKRDVKGGLTIFLANSQLETDIRKGCMRYDIPPHMQGQVVAVFVKGE